MSPGTNQDKLVRILVADDFAEWRIRVQSFLKQNPNLQIVAEACNGVEAVEKAAELHPDIVLLDIGMPFLNGIQAATAIRHISPDTKLIFVTQESDGDISKAALATGAERYVVKATAGRELLPAVLDVLGYVGYAPTA